MRAAAVRMNDDMAGGGMRMPFPVRWLMRRPRDSMAGLVAVVAGCAILINALFMQSGPHPAPMFADKPAPVAPVTTSRKADKVDVVRPRSDVVAEIQRELAKRGFYDGLNDGYYGPKTDAAIRDFERSTGLRPSAEPND